VTGELEISKDLFEISKDLFLIMTHNHAQVDLLGQAKEILLDMKASLIQSNIIQFQMLERHTQNTLVEQNTIAGRGGAEPSWIPAAHLGGNPVRPYPAVPPSWASAIAKASTALGEGANADAKTKV
jgi:hypothetical protein